MKRNSLLLVVLSFLIVLTAQYSLSAADERTGDLLDLLKTGQHVLANKEVSGTYEIHVLSEKRALALKGVKSRGGPLNPGIVVRIGRDYVIVKYETAADEKPRTKAIALHAISAIDLLEDEKPSVEPQP